MIVKNGKWQIYQLSWIVEVSCWITNGLLPKMLEIFTYEMNNIILCVARLNLSEVGLGLG